MGQHPSTPRPGTKLRVIGAGMSRTGTASFTRALEILLDGPVCHGGTQATLGTEREVRDYIDSLARLGYDPAYAGGRPFDPYSDDPVPRPDLHRPAADDEFIMRTLARRTEGYAAVTDFPFVALVPELVRLHPEAVVVVTLRDPDAWAKSHGKVAGLVLQSILPIALFWLPTMRLFPAFLEVLKTTWDGLGLTTPGQPFVEVDRLVWDRHQAWLRAVVPPERLILYDVKDGWGPLCKALGVDEPPVGVEFPHINDGEQIEARAKHFIQKGLTIWAVVLAVGSAVGAAAYYQFGRGAW